MAGSSRDGELADIRNRLSALEDQVGRLQRSTTFAASSEEYSNPVLERLDELCKAVQRTLEAEEVSPAFPRGRHASVCSTSDLISRVHPAALRSRKHSEGTAFESRTSVKYNLRAAQAAGNRPHFDLCSYLKDTKAGASASSATPGLLAAAPSRPSQGVGTGGGTLARNGYDDDAAALSSPVLATGPNRWDGDDQAPALDGTCRQASLRRRRRGSKSGHGTERQESGVSERSAAVACIDILFALVSVLVCVAATFIVHPQFPGSPFQNWLNVAGNACTQVVTGVWVISRFMVVQRKGFEMIDGRNDIRRGYLKSWFAYDLLYAVPIDFAFVAWQWEVYQWLQLRHFLRLARIFNLGNSSNPLLPMRLWFRFFSVCLYMLLTVGVLAAIFWWIESHHTYGESVYWAIATMTSVGYGDIVPVSFGGRVYVCFAMFFGIALLSTMTAFATSFLKDEDHISREETTLKQMLHAMLEYYEVPWDVQKEVIAAAPAMLEKSNELVFKEMSAKLPEFISEKIDGYARARLLRSIPLFEAFHKRQDALLLLARKLHHQFAAAGQAIIRQGTYGTDMYILRRGVVQVVVATDADPDVSSETHSHTEAMIDGVVVATLQAGDFFGEVEMLRDEVRRGSVVAVIMSELLVLSRKEFLDFVLQFPDEAEALQGSLLKSGKAFAEVTDME